MAPFAETILRCIARVRPWVLRATTADPDGKRPSMDCNVSVHSSKWSAYAAAIDVLKEAGIFDDMDAFTRAAAKHAANWVSDETVRHTMESAQALVALANNGEFDDQVYLDSYMDAPAFVFDIAPRPGVLSLAYREKLAGGCTRLFLDTATTEEEMRDILDEYNSDIHSLLIWSWTPCTVAGVDEYDEIDATNRAIGPKDVNDMDRNTENDGCRMDGDDDDEMA
jgi:hypothetical protein